MPETPEWLTVGAEVATLSDDWRRHHRAPRFAKVARIGKRDVVLDDDQRFNASRLERRNGGVWDGVTKLLPADAPVVAEAQAAYEQQIKVNRARMVVENWHYGREGTGPVEAILALAALTGREAEIRAALTAPTTPPTDALRGAQHEEQA